MVGRWHIAEEKFHFTSLDVISIESRENIRGEFGAKTAIKIGILKHRHARFRVAAKRFAMNIDREETGRRRFGFLALFVQQRANFIELLEDLLLPFAQVIDLLLQLLGVLSSRRRSSTE